MIIYNKLSLNTSLSSKKFVGTFRFEMVKNVFNEYLCDFLKLRLKELKFFNPTEVQQRAIPKILEVIKFIYFLYFYLGKRCVSKGYDRIWQNSCIRSSDSS
jgi:hypothetical protein